MVVYYVYSLLLLVFFFKQKTAYEMRISGWSSDVCSSDLTLTPSLTSPLSPDGTAPFAPPLFLPVANESRPAALSEDAAPSTVSGSKTVFGSVSNCPRRELPGLPMMVTGCAGTTGTAMELRCLPGGGSAGRCCASRSIGRAHVCTPVTNAPLV